MGGTGELLGLPELADLDQIDEAFYVPLHLLQPAQPVQLGQEILQPFQAAPSVSRGPAAAAEEAGAGGALPAGHKVPGVGPGALLRQPRPVAEGGELVGTGVCKAGLPVAHRSVHGGEEEEHQRHQVHKPPGRVLPVGLIIIQHLLKKRPGPESRTTRPPPCSAPKRRAEGTGLPLQ